MAVITSGRDLCIEVADLILDMHREQMRDPSKVLMSQRQYDVFRQWMHDREIGSEPWDNIYGYPIVICPDCDLYVP